LNSGDDERRGDRLARTVENESDGEAVEDQEVHIYPSDIGRMAEPEPGGGDVSICPVVKGQRADVGSSTY
jgi:hypothetical protein